MNLGTTSLYHHDLNPSDMKILYLLAEWERKRGTWKGGKIDGTLAVVNNLLEPMDESYNGLGF